MEVIAIIENNIITRLVDNDINLLENIKKQGLQYKIFNNALSLSIGENIEAYNEEGIKYASSILKEKGLLKLTDDETLDGETIREKTEVEKQKDNPDDKMTLDIDEFGAEYVRQKTMLEMYEESLVTKEEYNKWIGKQRENEYSKSTDEINFKLLFDDGLSNEEKEKLKQEITNKKKYIKEKHKKV